MTIEELKKTDWIAYEYIRGSHAYGLNTPDSDVDMGGVFIEPIDWLLGLGLDYRDQIQDEKHDNVYYSLKKYFNLLLSSNPTVLESLFIPEKCVIYESPIITEIKSNRDKFITKACFKPFLGYAYEQIKKCRSLNKLFINPVNERKEVLDFCYTFKNQGSQPMKEFLSNRKLNQKYCGLVNIPNMKDTYGVYYDFAAYFKFEKLSEDEQEECMVLNGLSLQASRVLIQERIQNREWFGYTGIVNPDGTSNEVRLSSIPKGEIPICFMTYNQNGYESHCKKYKEYMDWVVHRNPVRYKENEKKTFDRKNVAHSVRLLHMGLEIAKGEGFNVDRTNIDKDFIMNIREGNATYEEVISYVEKKKNEMEIAMANSNLPEKIDEIFLNNLLIKIRKQFI